MIRIITSFLILIVLSFSAQANQPTPENCEGAVKGRIAVWDFTLTKEDRALVYLTYLIPEIPEIFNLKCVKSLKDIIPTEDKTQDQINFTSDYIAELWKDTRNLLINTTKYAGYLIVLYCLARLYQIICFVFDSKKLQAVPEELITSSIWHTILLSINYPVFAGGALSFIQVAMLYAVLNGSGLANMEYRSILSFYQTGTVITDNVDIEKRVSSNSEKNKGQIYAEAYEYEYNMNMIELAKLKSENVTYDAFRKVPQNTINNSVKEIQNSSFTIANNFNGSSPGEDVSYNCGKVIAVVPNLSEAEPDIQKIAKDTDFVETLKSVAANVTLENPEAIRDIWTSYKYKLMTNLKINNISEMTETQSAKMRYFLSYIHAYANANSFYSNTVDNNQYSASFNKLNERRRDIAILINSAICVSGAINAQENIMKIDRGISAQCGYFKDGNFGEIITQSGSNSTVFENKAKALIKQNMAEIQSAKMKIEAIYETSRLELTNYSDFVKYSKCGYACLTNALKMAEKNNIANDLNSFRKSIDVVPNADSQMLCVGSFEFENIKPQLKNDLETTNTVITNVFKDFMPAESMGIDTATLIAGTVNSRVEAENKSILSAFSDLVNPMTYIRNGAGIPSTADFTAENFATCSTEGRTAATCPIPRNGFFQTNENVLDSFRNAGEKILMTGLIAKFAVQTISAGASVADAVKGKKAKDVGSVSADKAKAATANKAGKSSFLQKLYSMPGEALSAMSDGLITIGGYIIMISMACIYAISLVTYITFINITISYHIAAVITIITVPLWTTILILSSNLKSVVSTYTRIIVGFITIPPILVFFILLIHQFANLFYLGLYLLLSTTDAIQGAIDAGEFGKTVINFILTIIFFIFGGYYFIKIVRDIIMSKYRSTLDKIGEATKSGVDSTTDIIYAKTLYAVQSFVRTIKNKGTNDNSVKLSEKNKKDLKENKKE